MTSRTELRTFGQLALSGALVVALIAGGQYFVDSIGRAGAEREAKTLLAMASTAAAAMEPEKVIALSGPAGADRTAAARDIGDELRRLHDALQHVRFIYLARRKGDAIEVLADAGGLAPEAGPLSPRIAKDASARLSSV